MAELIPWSEFEEEYAENFSEKMGAIAKPFRMALGALIIKEKLRTSDRETVEQIKENPYLQYFLGMSDYTNEPPFDTSMMVYFRERIDENLVNQINRKMVKNFTEKDEEESEKKNESGDLKTQVEAYKNLSFKQADSCNFFRLLFQQALVISACF